MIRKTLLAIMFGAFTTPAVAQTLASDLSSDSTFIRRLGARVPSSRMLTINGVSFDLSVDRVINVGGGSGGSVTSVAGRTGAVTLDTLDIANFTGGLNQLRAVIAGKVDAVPGKQLSTEDYTSAEKTKLAGIAPGATANSTDAQLRDRSTHTGTQAISTVTGLQTALDGKANLSGATFTGAVTATNISGTNTGDQTNVPGNAGTVTTIAGKIVAGANVTVSGDGTNASPYSISSTAGGGGGGSNEYRIGRKWTTWGPQNSNTGTTLLTSGTGFAGSPSATGTAANLAGPAKVYGTYTSRYNSYTYTTGAAANSQAGIGTASAAWSSMFRGAATTEGGFKAYFRFAASTFAGTGRLHVGLIKGLVNASTEPAQNGGGERFMLGKESGDTSLAFYALAVNGGTVTKTTINRGINQSSIYELVLTSIPGGSSIDAILYEYNASGRNTLYSGSFTTNIPGADVYLQPVCYINSGTGTAAVTLNFYGAEFSSDY